VLLEPRDGQQAVYVDKVDGEIELVQVFIAVQPLDVADVVDGDVEGTAATSAASGFREQGD